MQGGKGRKSGKGGELSHSIPSEEAAARFHPSDTHALPRAMPLSVSPAMPRPTPAPLHAHPMPRASSCSIHSSESSTGSAQSFTASEPSERTCRREVGGGGSRGERF